jgi:spore coat-associated protein N
MSIKKKMGMALASTALGAMLIGGGTFALFTSTANNSGNTFTAGTLEVSAGNVAVYSGATFSNLAPGDSGDATLTVTNTGSLDAFVKIDDIINESGGLFDGGANQLQITYDTATKVAPAGGTATFDIHYYFPLDADDSYEGDTGSFDIKVKAVQVRNNDADNNGEPDRWN